MAEYEGLDAILRSMTSANADELFSKDVIPLLVDAWVTDYTRSTRGGGLVQTTVDGFEFMFDVSLGRLVAAWGISRGRHDGKRPKSRMAGHPRSGGPGYHRGHAIPHTLGGPVDINLVPQLGSINSGAFQKLEQAAVETPGALYFTYWMYGPANNQKPLNVQQGLLRPGRDAELTTHGN